MYEIRLGKYGNKSLKNLNFKGINFKHFDFVSVCITAQLQNH